MQTCEVIDQLDFDPFKSQGCVKFPSWAFVCLFVWCRAGQAYGVWGSATRCRAGLCTARLS